MFALEMPEVCRELSRAGHRVEVVLEPGARAFVGPAALSRHVDVVEKPTEDPEAILFAPAAAGTLARLARGLGGGAATEAYFGGARPAIVVPELDEATARHPALLENLGILKDDGCRVVGFPEDAAPDATELISTVLGNLDGPLSGLRVLVSAGGTREPIDSVRFVGNRSSGKMGTAIAREALRMGAEVSVVAANIEVAVPGTLWIPVENVDQLKEAILDLASACDVLIMAAAVSDFKPSSVAESKIRRSEGLSLELVATEDVLKSVREQNPDLFVVGFAATHGDPVPDARKKLGSKGVNLVVGNDISREGIGFESDENEVYVVGAEGERFVPQASKQDVARAILGDLAREMKKERRVYDGGKDGGDHLEHG